MDELSGEIGGQSPASDASPASGTSDVSTGSAPIAQDTTGAGGEATGPIPFDRHKTILENTRTKTRAEVEAQFAWAKDLNPEQVRGLVSWQQWLEEDPDAALEFIQGRYKGRLKSGQHSQTAPQRPKPSLRTEDGRMVYEAEQVESLLAEQERKLQQLIAPLSQRFEMTEAQTRAQSEARQELAEAQTWDGFTDHVDAIKAEMQRDKRLTLKGAYIRVVVPKLKQIAREALVKELQQKAGATTVNPGSASASTSKPVAEMSWSEALKHEWNRRKA